MRVMLLMMRGCGPGLSTVEHDAAESWDAAAACLSGAGPHVKS